MKNYDLDTDYILSQYQSANPIELETLAVAAESTNTGNSSEPNVNTNPVYIETVERPTYNKRFYDEAE